ncbi:MAG: hypothetical protein ACOXZS_02330 [Bacilli bacterium]|jgi:hypothetical protein
MLTDVNNRNYLPKELFGIIDNGFTVMETFDLLGNTVFLGDRTDIGPYEIGNYKFHFND